MTLTADPGNPNLSDGIEDQNYEGKVSQEEIPVLSANPTFFPRKNKDENELEEIYKEQTQETEEEFIKRIKSEKSSNKLVLVNLTKREVVCTAESWSALAEKQQNKNSGDELKILRNYDKRDYSKVGSQ